MTKSRYLALTTATATATTPSFRKGRQVRLTDAQAAPLLEAGAIKPLGLPDSQRPAPASTPEKSKLAANPDKGGTKDSVESNVIDPVTDSGLPEQSVSGNENPVEQDPSQTDPPTDTSTSNATAENTVDLPNGEVSDPTVDLVADIETETSETNSAPEEPVETKVRYQIEVDDPDGGYAMWFNELAEAQGLDIQFDSSSGRPVVEVPSSVDEETVSGWVGAFRNAYPDYASVTYTPLT